MHDQRTPAEQDDVADRSIMDVLLDDPGPWAVEELQREFLAPIAVVDSLGSRRPRSTRLTSLA